MNTAEFFEAIFGDAISPERRLSIFTIPGKRSQRFADAGSAAEYALSFSDRYHVYHGMGAIAGDPPGRGKFEHMCAIGSLWCDLDAAGDAHGQGLPESKTVALEFLLGLAIRPGIVVDSGNGLHGYWPLDVPLAFATGAQRAEASRITKGWHQWICDQAKERGWTLPNLGDLTRVLRVPGTWNSKTDPAKPVEIIHCSGEVFGMEAMLAVSNPPEPPAPTPAPQVVRIFQPAGPSPLERCKAYLDELPPAMADGMGGKHTLKACKAIYRFGLEGSDVRAAFEYYNAKCVPPWTIEKQIEHKLADALKSVSAAGEFGKWLEGLPTADPVGEAAAAAILKSANGKPAVVSNDAPRNPGDFPADCLLAPGLIAEIINFNLETAMYPQPELALAGAIALVATITGRKITDAFGTRTNLYILGLAPSGGGKEHARKINKEILLRAGADTMIGHERIASSAGLVAAVADRKAVLFQIDEIGKLLATMKNPGKQPHLYNIGTVLLQLYSSSDSLWIADAYADSKKTKRINQPHACVYGTSVNSAFWDNLTTENVSEGLLGRLLAFEASVGYVPMRRPLKQPVPDSIIHAVRWWIEFKGDPQAGNLTDENPTPFVVGYSPAAQQRINEHLESICSRRTKESETTAAVWSRSGEKAAKLALIFACSRATNSMLPRVEFEDIDRAIKIANWLTRKMLRKAFEHVAENETESRSKKLLRIVGGEMTMTELTRKTQWLRAKERSEIIYDLQSAGYLSVEQKETNGRPVTYLRRAT